MIKTIRLQNFQSHKNTLIDFKPGLNVIAGSSDAGKSSVMRALSWVINNRPSGDDVRNWESKKDAIVSIEIILDNGIIKKERQNNKVMYTTDKYPLLEAVGRDVPEEVSNVLNIADINIQQQHDPYFLLTASSGQVAKTLNETVGLSVIDSSFKHLNSDITSLKSSIDTLTIEIAKHENDIKGLDYVDNLANDITRAERTQKVIEKTESDLLLLNNILTTASTYNEKLKDTHSIIKAEKYVDALLETTRQYRELNLKKGDITYLINQVNRLEVDQENCSLFLKIEKPFKTYLETLTTISEMNGEISVLNKLISSITEFTLSISKNKRKIVLLKDDLIEMLRKAKICPVCFRSFDLSTIERIVI